jgi:hypothetical protein
MATESSTNNPLVVKIDQDTRVEAVFSQIVCGNIGDRCNLRGSPGTIVYSECCDGLVCLSDSGNDFWAEGDNQYGVCQSPPPPPPPQPPTTPEVRNTFVLRVSSNTSTGGSVDTREIVGGANVNLERTTTITRGFERVWTASSPQVDVTIIATPRSGFRFVGWQNINNASINNPSSTSQTINILAGTQVVIEAIFEEIVTEPNNVTVTIENSPSTLGSATFISTGRSAPLTVDRNSNIQVTANPNTSQTVFKRWEVRRVDNNQLITTLYNSTDTVRADRDLRVVAYWEVQRQEEIRGCTDPKASNFNPNATVSDGSCTYPPPIAGCTNRSAVNYNPNAEIDDGTCVFPRTWKRCSDGADVNGDAPSDYRLVNDTRPGGSTCWEPIGDIAIDLRDINFTYQRGTANFPAPQNFRAENSSFGLTYEISLNTNNQLFEIKPNKFVLGPRENKQISIGVSRNNIERFGDGISNFNLVVDTQVVGGEAAIPPIPPPPPPPPPPTLPPAPRVTPPPVTQRPPVTQIPPQTVVVNCSPTGIVGDECEPYTVEGTFNEGIDQLCTKIGKIRCNSITISEPIREPEITDTITVPTTTPVITIPATTACTTGPAIPVADGSLCGRNVNATKNLYVNTTTGQYYEDQSCFTLAQGAYTTLVNGITTQLYNCVSGDCVISNCPTPTPRTGGGTIFDPGIQSGPTNEQPREDRDDSTRIIEDFGDINVF